MKKEKIFNVFFNNFHTIKYFFIKRQTYSAYFRLYLNITFSLFTQNTFIDLCRQGRRLQHSDIVKFHCAFLLSSWILLRDAIIFTVISFYLSSY